jgi:5-methylcytosine-specific restriction endonuclease McrA
MISNRSSLSVPTSGAAGNSEAARTPSAAQDSSATEDSGAVRNPATRATLSAREVHDRLCTALSELQRAERSAVLWFAEIVRRKLYRDLGYASVHQYAELALGWGKSKTSQFLHLSECLQELPQLRRSMAAGELSWTKAREVAKVATPRTETAWIQEAKHASSRALEAKVKATRKRARAAGSAAGNQGELAVGASAGSSAGSGSVSTGSAGSGSEPSLPMDVHLRMTPEQYARYQALIEAIRKRGRREDRAELVLAALEQLALISSEPAANDTRPSSPGSGDGVSDHGRGGSGQTGRPEFTRVNSRSPYQVVVQQCPDCGSGRVATNRGDRKLAPQELRAVLCDAYKRLPGKTNRAAVPGSVRRAVLQRDRFRCRSAGCGGTSFLAVHHLVPRERGGENALENLITLCSGCHRALHAREGYPRDITMNRRRKG